MYLLVATNFVAIPLAFMAHPAAGPLLHDSFIPGVQGGLNATSVLLIIAMVGTTVAPWQLFFQQSNVIDKRLTPRWMAYERADTAIGAVVVVVGAAAGKPCQAGMVSDHPPGDAHAARVSARGRPPHDRESCAAGDWSLEGAGRGGAGCLSR